MILFVFGNDLFVLVLFYLFMLWKWFYLFEFMEIILFVCVFGNDFICKHQSYVSVHVVS